ncbi:MAG: hypothetical protein K2K52_00340 [Paramuribaculum sp.]|nr:hypothetical protein [Paramuribaculum sp.]
MPTENIEVNLIKNVCMRKCLGIVLMIIVCCSSVSANDKREDCSVKLAGGIYLNNEQAWILEPSVNWNFHKYFGAGLGVELTRQYNQPIRFTTIDGYQADLTDTDRNIGWIILKPHIILKSPDIWRSSESELRLWFEAEPGLSLACPFCNSLTYEIKEFKGNVSHTVDYRKFKNKGLKWFYWYARIGMNFAINRYILGAGYCISNLDYYSCRRNVSLANGEKFSVPKKELSQSIYLSIGYTF